MSRRKSGCTIFAAVLTCLLTGSANAQDTSPLWAFAPTTISPEWEPVLEAIGADRSKSAPAPDDLAGWRDIQDARIVARAPRAARTVARFGATYEEIEIGGVPVLEITPEHRVSKTKFGVFLHGGAYVSNSARTAIAGAAQFAQATGLSVFSIDYSLAPHVKWQHVTDEVVSVLAGLVEAGVDSDDIVVFGESAGASLAAGSVLKMRDQGMSMPAALILWSPWSDISETGDTYVTLRNAEPFYTYEHYLRSAALAYADAADHRHPYVSPVYGDYTKGFPPTLIQGGTKEIFLSNFIRHYQAIDQAGQRVKLDLYEGMPHVFMTVLPDTTEAQIAVQKSVDWVNTYLIGE